MKINNIYLLACIMLFAACSTLAQPQDDGLSKNKKAMREYQTATGLSNSRRYSDALKPVNKAITLDKDFVAAYDLKSQILFALRRNDEMIENYRTMLRVIPIETREMRETFYILASLEKDFEMYDSAVAHFEKFLTFEKVDKRSLAKARIELASCKFAANAILNPVDFNPVNMGPGVNTELDEYHPGITLDGEQFIFTRLIKSELFGMQEDFYQSSLIGGKWSKAKNLGEPVNTESNEGTITLTANGKYIFFTACNRQRNVGSCDLYFAKFDNGTWGKAKILPPPLNSTYWDSQPSIAPDGKTIYFTSARSGGKGGKDLWVAILQNGKIEEPKNLGGVINTVGNETGPSIHADGKTLYFSSDGHPGMGNADFFVTRMDADGNWSKPENLGYPINSKADEKGIVVSRQGDFAYMASRRKGGYGGLDIYTFKLPETKQASPVSYVKGLVYDKETKLPIGTNIELSDLSTGETLLKFDSDPKTGSFFIVLESNKDYGFTIDKTGYLFHSENFSLKQTTELKPYVLKIGLAKPKNGESIVLKNVLFDTDKFDIKIESNLELDKVVGFMKDNPGIKIEIAGHTDNKGTESHNKLLSQNRAKAVVEFLLNKGVDKSRLNYKGYGSTNPIDSNETEEGRKNNRRTEMRIL